MEYTKELLENAHEFLTQKGVTSMGDNINAFMVERYLVEFALRTANGDERSRKTALNIDVVIKCAFYAGANSRNEEYETQTIEDAWRQFKEKHFL